MSLIDLAMMVNGLGLNWCRTDRQIPHGVAAPYKLRAIDSTFVSPVATVTNIALLGVWMTKLLESF